MEPRPTWWGWSGRLSPRTFDLVIVAVLTILGVVSTVLDPFVRGLGSPNWLAVGLALGLTLVQTIPLYWRRRAPDAVLLLVGAAFAIKVVLGVNAGVGGFGLLIAMYSLAAYGAGRRRLWALVVAGLVFLSGFAAFVLVGNPHLIAISVPALAFVAAWLIGDYLGTRRAYISALEERARRLERERRLDRQVAADEERARIARELHDVVAHDVSVIAVQAGAARTVQQTHPQAAAEALALIETTARKTLIELSQLLGVLRRVDGEAAQRTPQPGLAQAPQLVDELRSAGLSVEYRQEGEPRPLPQALDLSAYRILQESTTNVLKHARARHVEIMVTYRPDEVVLRVRDDGAGRSATTASSGHGLVGMKERAALFRGEVESGPLRGGGFEVLARLPIVAAG